MDPAINDQYFEAILQLRPERPDVIEFILQAIAANKKVWISKTVGHKTGIDIYLSSNIFAKYIGQKLKKRFKGTLKYSSTVHTTDKMTSKQLYRVTVLYRLPKEEKK